MATQAAAQEKWKAEKTLVLGAAPHVLVGGRRRKAAATSPIDASELAKQLKAIEARAKKAEAEAKRLRDAKALAK